MNWFWRSIISLVLIVGLYALAPGCGGEHGAYFPENYKDSYKLIHGCAPTEEHSSPFFMAYINSEAYDAWAAFEVLPEGSTLVKVQYKNSNCTVLDVYTVMRKGPPGTAPDSMDWEWQNADEYGQVVESGQVNYCITCHSGCETENNPDFACLRPGGHIK